MELKRDLPHGLKAQGDPRRLARIEQARDVAQFTNTFGGTLLYGVDEGEASDGRNVARAVVSLAELDRKRAWIEESVRRFLVPNTVAMAVHALNVNGDHVLAVNVPASRSPIAVWDDQKRTLEYVRRTSHGKQNMDPDNAIHFMLDRSRAATIGIHRVRDEIVATGTTLVSVDLVGGVQVRAHGGALSEASVNVTFADAEEHEFVLNVHDHVLRVPYGLVREVWRTTKNGMGLMLYARVVIDKRKDHAMLDVIG